MTIATELPCRDPVYDDWYSYILGHDSPCLYLKRLVADKLDF